MVRARRPSRLLAVGLGLTVLVLVAQAADVLESWELDTVDARFAIRGDEEPPPDLVLVLIDTKTFNELPRALARWPFRRIVHARVLDRLREDRVRAVAYDIQFIEPSERPDDDNALVTAATKLGGRITFSTTEVNERGEGRCFGGGQFLVDRGIRCGHGTSLNDSDGAIRRLPYEIDGLKSFALMGAEIVLARTIEGSELPQNPAWIDYLGGAGTVPSISFSDVYLGKTPRGRFRNKVVVIGASAAALQDLHETATTGAGQLMPGPEVQANTLATALRGFPLSGTPEWFDFLLTIVAGLVVPVAALRLSFRATLVFAIGAGLLLLVATQLAFQGGYMIAFLYPFLALMLSTVATTTSRSWT